MRGTASLHPAPQAVQTAVTEAIDNLIARFSTASPLSALLAAAIGRAVNGGKLLRPSLVVAAWVSLSQSRTPPAAVTQLAAAFELLHGAFVVHDDLIDGDTVRRGSLNVAGEFERYAREKGADPASAATLGTAAAVLAGDLLLHESQRIVALAEMPADVRARIIAIFDEAVLISAVGELADVAHETLAPSHPPESADVLSATHDKTAIYSFAAPLRVGAILADAEETQVTALAEFGSRLGTTFQLVDDLIGAFGTVSQAGRESGADLSRAKVTPLVTLARESTSWPAVEDALAQAHTGPIALRRAQEALDDSGARRVLEGQILDELARIRSDASSSATLPPAARTLVATIADSVEARIP